MDDHPSLNVGQVNHPISQTAIRPERLVGTGKENRFWTNLGSTKCKECICVADDMQNQTMGPTISQNKASHWSPWGSSLLLRSDLARSLERHLAAWHLVCWRCAHWSASGRMWLKLLEEHILTSDCMFVSNPSILQDPFQVPATRACFQELRVFKLKIRKKRQFLPSKM